MKFEMNVDSFQRYINTRRDKAKEVSKEALLRANEEIDEIIYQTAPVHVQGYFEHGIEWAGGTLRDSFVEETYIGHVTIPKNPYRRRCGLPFHVAASKVKQTA